MPTDFWIFNVKFNNLIDEATDWFLKSRKFKKKSPERQICLLREEICRREAKKYNKKILKILERKLNG
jgi:hypothetical protein